MNKSFLKHIFFVLTVVLLVSCDNDFNEVGANVVGDDNYLGEQETYDVTAFNLGLGAVDSKNLPVAPLGIYDNPVFGKTKANFVTQVQLAEENPVINLDLQPVISSVVLKIPYYSTLRSTNSEGVGDYELDSIFGNGSKIKLDIYESNYYLRDLDPVLGTPQNYFSDQNADFASSVIGTPLNDGLAIQNSEFVFSNKQYIDVSDEDVTTRVAPQMRINLNVAAFQAKLFSQAAIPQLLNNNLFKNYFRGLYFHVDQSGSDAGQLAMLNFALGTITVTYMQYPTVPVAGTPLEKVEKTLTLNFTGNSVSLLENTETTDYSNAVTNANQTTGDDKLFLRGGQGSMAVIELFRDKAELDQIRANNWLVNDASLTFYVDQNTMNAGDPKAVEPQRIFLYDLNNKRTLIDYSTDVTVNSNNTKRNKVIFGGIIQTDSDKRGTHYKIKLTNYLQTLLRYSDSTNVRLGLVVTENINVVTNKKLKNPKGIQQNIDLKPFAVKEVPSMSVAHPFGTVLFGGGLNVPEDKRLKLTVYYTKPN